MYVRNLPKHERYNNAYRAWGWYWGLGVEHETYIATSQTRRVPGFTVANMKPERYSVSYYRNYKYEPLMAALAAVVADVSGGGGLNVPVLMNCHSLTDCDIYGEHQTTYERVPTPNSRYAGQSLYEWMCTHSQWLRDELGNVFMWDGDTVEFMTQRFYRARVADVIAELRAGYERFVAEINRIPRAGLLAAYAPLRLATPINEPWATYLTHQRGVAMFNNGTIHINATMPTRLDWRCRPLRWGRFVEEHRRLARLIQWMEPLWIAVYGSGDPLRRVSRRYAAGSQRLAVSRYIGVGTYDTETMPTGKIVQLQKPAETGPLPWYDWLHARTDYAPLGVVGLDLNFNKHGAHGLEIRIFDQMSLEAVEACLRDVVVLMDVARSRVTIPNPVRDGRWQRATGYALYDGSRWKVEPEYCIALAAALGTGGDFKEPRSVGAALAWVRGELVSARSYCWREMVGVAK
jgi:hypothetical protein